MFEIGDYVVYSTTGVCKIADIKTEEFGNANQRYYIIENVFGNKSYVHVPVDNDVLLSKMRHIHSKKELLEILEKVKKETVEWITDYKTRNETNNSILKSCNLFEIIKLLKVSCENEKRNIEFKKKTSMTDKRISDTAEKLVVEEFSISFEKDFEETKNMISEKLELNLGEQYANN